MTAELGEVGEVAATIALVSLNEEKTIAAALGALIEESESTGSEIIVMAGGKDRTVEIVAEMVRNRSRARLIVDSTPRGKPAALNTMFSLAKGPIVVLSDGDVEVRRGSVKPLLEALGHEDVGAASGRVVGKPGKYNAVEKACDLMTEMMHLSRLRLSGASGTLELASGYLYALRKDLARKVPEHMNSDDGFLSLCVRSAGKKIAYVPDAVVAIGFPKAIGDFIRQKMRTRFGHMQLRNEFRNVSPRSAGGEMKELRMLSGVARSRGYGPAVPMLALVLTALAWAAAYLRRYAPWLFRKPVWQPIGTTK
jgi:cellulose synthase/poly-beta-1,6-N-acetylglucosamine synthase-like glycosyltransferase